jgi:hypothetical protein
MCNWLGVHLRLLRMPNSHQMAYVLEYRTRLDLPYLPDSECVDVIAAADYRRLEHVGINLGVN